MILPESVELLRNEFPCALQSSSHPAGNVFPRTAKLASRESPSVIRTASNCRRTGGRRIEGSSPVQLGSRTHPADKGEYRPPGFDTSEEIESQIQRQKYSPSRRTESTRYKLPPHS